MLLSATGTFVISGSMGMIVEAVLGPSTENAAEENGYYPKLEPDDDPEGEDDGEPYYELGPPVFYMLEGGVFELPLAGAGGFAAVTLHVRAAPEEDANVIRVLDPGHGFTIVSESGDWWNILVGNVEGWVKHRYCFINLPDIIPSIVYNVTNAYSSVKRSLERDIPGVTGHALHNMRGFNERLNRYEFIVPALYTTAKRVFRAQQAALADGNTLVIYEAFRPAEVQRLVVGNLTAMAGAYPEISRSLNTPPWNIHWFVSTGISNHQRGAAIDASLARIAAQETRTAGRFAFMEITEYEEFPMQTKMHELSPLAAVRLPWNLDPEVEINISAALPRSVSYGTVLMQRYFAYGGMYPLPSEWWHFNDNVSRVAAEGMEINGDFSIETVYSRIPST